MPINNNPYNILGVEELCDNESLIRKSYRKLALKYHPDKNKSPEAEEMFLKISEALKILTTPDEKSELDERIKARKHQQERYASQREDRKNVIDDLLRREQEYLVSLKSNLKDEMMNQRMQKKKEEKKEERKESEIDILMRETKRKEREQDREDFENEQKQKRLKRKRQEETKTIVRMKWDKKKAEYSKGLIKTIFEGFWAYTPNVVMDTKPGVAFVEFLDLKSAKEAFEEISQEKSDFKLKLISSEKSKVTKPSVPKIWEVDEILKLAGVVLENRDPEFESLPSLELMEETLRKKIENKYSNN